MNKQFNQAVKEVRSLLNEMDSEDTELKAARAIRYLSIVYPELKTWWHEVISQAI